MKLEDLSPADRRRIKAGKLSTGAAPSAVFSIESRSRPAKGGEASVDVSHMKCHTCGETFTAQTGIAGWETHADRTGHRRIELVLRTLAAVCVAVCATVVGIGPARADMWTTTVVDAPQGLWVLPAVPTQATGCYSLAGAKLPNGTRAPATWWRCTTGDHTITFPSDQTGQTVAIHWFGGWSRAGSISYSAYPYATVTL